jgi:hypothetical protein
MFLGTLCIYRCVEARARARTHTQHTHTHEHLYNIEITQATVTMKD